MKTKLKIALLSLAAVAVSATTTLAAEYPDRPIGVAVSYGAGGATDFQARIVTMVAGNKDMLGQPIYILNKPGAGGRRGWNWFATEAEADGYKSEERRVGKEGLRLCRFRWSPVP